MKQTVIMVAVVAVIFNLTPGVDAQTDRTEVRTPEFFERPGDRALMTRVILHRLTIWTRPDGTPIYYRTCRQLRHGCERQISTYVDYIFNIGRSTDIDPWLLAGIAWHESRFNAFAVSSAGAVGIFQLLARGVWSRGLPFVRQRWYRERCRRELGSCQRPIVERAAYWLQWSVAHCGSLNTGLRLYNSGRCDGPTRYPRAVLTVQGDLLRRANEIRDNGFVDPIRPDEGPIYSHDIVNYCSNGCNESNHQE